MKINPDKFHLLVSFCEKIKMEIGYFKIENSTCEKLLGVHFENRLTFITIYQSFARKLLKINALTRVSRYMSLSKKKS